MATTQRNAVAKLATLRDLARRSDFLAAAALGMVGLSFGYYILLIQVSDLGRVADAISTEPAYLAGVAVLFPISLGLFGLNLGALVVLRRARMRLRAQAGTALGATTGALAAGCPVCGAYLLPLLGVTSGLAALPFGGLELWALTAGIMGFTLRRSLGALQGCAGDSPGSSCADLPAPRRKEVARLAVVAVLLAAGLMALVLVNEPALVGR